MSIKTDNSQTLVNALAEIERLRGRCAELEYHADRMLNAIKADDFALYDEAQYAADKLLFDSTEDYLLFKEDGHKASEAWLLRKQAEAVEAALSDDSTALFFDREYVRVQDLEEYAQRLRNEADELENNNEQEH